MQPLAPYWNFLLVHPLVSLLIAAYDLVHDFGFAVVVVTVAIRLLLYPLFKIQIRNQRAMQELAPAMAELKAKYGSDKQRLGQEQMKLYQERGYNPAMGCLPLLLQMPLLLAMYAGFQFFVRNPPPDGLEIGSVIWPFLPNPIGPGQTLDLTAHWLPWLSNGLGQHDPLYILPVLAGATQLISSVMFQPAIQPKTVDPQQKMMQSMQYYFPLITVFIAASVPSGLAVYWVTTTLFGIVQQYFVSGWGQLPRFLPFLKNIPSPADRTLAARQQAALEEERRDMAAKAQVASNGPGAQGATGAQNTREARRQRNRNKKK
ncbi:MAG TPA: YidC/Oxa1 family membrane protein insertase [Candidatus Limnocylindria bacterium]|nr:YidC/Oxa1 family membrane protein insertase [Candidatus Limnocylindria bacterium]